MIKNFNNFLIKESSEIEDYDTLVENALSLKMDAALFNNSIFVNLLNAFMISNV